MSRPPDARPVKAGNVAIIDVAKHGRYITTLYPTRHCFKASDQPNTVPSIRSTLLEDLYIINAGRTDGVRDCGLSDVGAPGQKYRRVINAHVNPLVSWLWVGWLMVVAGTLLALVPNEAAVRVPQPAAVPATAGEVGVMTSTGAGD